MKAVLLLNVGSPRSPSIQDIKRYLTQFLTDPRVITKPYLLRQLLVRFLIIPLRKKKVAKLYSAIWTDKGAPLICHSENIKSKLQAALGNEYFVDYAMSYQCPCIPFVLEQIKEKQASSVHIIPLFPQYASASSGSAIEAALKEIQNWQKIPSLTVTNQFCENRFFIDAFAENAKRFDLTQYDHFLFSFHG